MELAAGDERRARRPRRSDVALQRVERVRLPDAVERSGVIAVELEVAVGAVVLQREQQSVVAVVPEQRRVDHRQPVEQAAHESPGATVLAPVQRRAARIVATSASAKYRSTGRSDASRGRTQCSSQRR
jgi:hypothetical protein